MYAGLASAGVALANTATRYVTGGTGIGTLGATIVRHQVAAQAGTALAQSAGYAGGSAIAGGSAAAGAAGASGASAIAGTGTSAVSGAAGGGVTQAGFLARTGATFGNSALGGAATVSGGSMAAIATAAVAAEAGRTAGKWEAIESAKKGNYGTAAAQGASALLTPAASLGVAAYNFLGFGDNKKDDLTLNQTGVGETGSSFDRFAEASLTHLTKVDAGGGETSQAEKQTGLLGDIRDAMLQLASPVAPPLYEIARRTRW
jgi:hypothetical protein